ncbi:hypothetical protein ABEB36_015719 [Hypothenemus hampei]|uniref:Transposable element P transposase-like RNase H C-terminal domain-containing protein n=1 Tax=Hypothenemus hampei TaxID=57062 RepID=A0ABD1DZS9_HYPHA
MKFKNINGKIVDVPSVRGWLQTLHSLRKIWFKLEKEGFTFMSTRNFNQDPVENFFAAIRDHQGRNINPTCNNFIASFKTLTINNFQTIKSPGSNCEEDGSDGVLTNLKTFMCTEQEHTELETTMDERTALSIINRLKKYVASKELLNLNLDTYIAGFVAKKLIQKIGNCDKCKKNLTSVSGTGVQNTFIRFRAYTPKSLLFPESSFSAYFSELYFHCPQLFDMFCTGNNLKLNMSYIMKRITHFPHDCNKHNLQDIIIEFVTHFYILAKVRNIVKILKGLRQPPPGGYKDYLNNLAFTKSKMFLKK